MRRGRNERDDRYSRDQELPTDGELVGLDEPAHPHDVDRAEEQQQRSRDEIALGRQHRPAARDGHERGDVVRRVQEGGLDHDRPDGYGAEECDPAAREAEQATESEPREAGAAPRHRVHATELGVSKCEEHHRAAAKQPGDDRGRPGERGGIQGAKQPAGADERPQRGE